LANADLKVESLRLQNERLDLAHDKVAQSERFFKTRSITNAFFAAAMGGSPSRKSAESKVALSKRPESEPNLGQIKPDQATDPAPQPKIKPD
jgi:hypothetical protein